MRAVPLRGVSAGIVLLLVVFALATQRALSRGHREMQASNQAFDAGELDAAVRHARRAAGLYVPGAAHVSAGYARLRAVALGAERSRDLRVAAAAWHGVRTAALQSRHLWQPHSEELALAERNLERLGFGAPATLDALSVRPQPLSTLALSCGWVCCGVGILLGIGRGKRAGRWVFGRMAWPLALAAISAATLAVSAFTL